MDKSITIQRRSSLNATRLSAYPIAESTCVHLNSTRTGEDFQWGSPSMSPKNRSNSSGCLANCRDKSHKKCVFTMSNSSMRSSERNGENSSKIDPRIYADVQSHGLVARIVKYHENGTRINRSMSMNNLYNRPGQFPVVNLKKTQLPYRAIKQPLSMTRIAPPEKSKFHGNTLSSLLRSNSVLGLQKSDEHISHENRPILHPPPTESDFAPTRSVLDVLKEISRKRINNDDLDVGDATKKYCNRDVMDTAGTSMNSYDLQQQHQQQIRNTNLALSYKRQREQQICGSDGLSQSLMSNQLSSVTPLTNRIEPGQKCSPEQLAKKRLCSYNNDITSSLSSSLYHANKRKFYEQLNISNGSSHSTKRTPPEYELQKAKMQRQYEKLRLERLTKTLNDNTIPITPIPDTPGGQANGLVTSRSTASTAISPTSQPVKAQVHKSVSEPIRLGKAATGNAARNNKPKLTLFNKQYDEEAEQNSANKYKPASPQDECAGIQFVKPKNIAAVSGIKNPSIERTQKSKLALMLCGLRGELNQSDDEDEVDDARKNGAMVETQQTTAASPAIAGQCVMVDTVMTNTTTTTVTTAATMATTNAGCDLTNSQPAPVTLTPTTSAAATASAVATATAASTTPKTTTTNAVPTLGGFKFTPPPTMTSVQKNAVALPKSPNGTAIKTTSSLVGLKLTPQTISAMPAINAAPTFTFGSPTTTAVTTTATAAPLPVLGGFSFSPAGNTKPTILNTVAAINAAPAAFGFGANTSIATTVVTTAAPVVFGASINSADANQKATAPAKAPSFIFGTTISSSDTKANTTPTATVSALGSVTAISTITTSNTLTTSTSSATSATGFGIVNNSASNDAKASPFDKAATLDAKTAVANDNKTPTFGAAASTNVFGSINNGSTFSASNIVKPFTFGSASANSAAPNATVTTTTNPVSSGNANVQANNFFSATAQKPGATAAPFLFNAAGTKPQNTTATVMPNSFAFGNGPNNTPTTNNNNSFTFEAMNTSTNPNPTTSASTSTASNSFSFGSAPSAISTMKFGGGNTTQTTNSVGNGGFLFDSAAAGAAAASQTAQAIFGSSSSSGTGATTGNNTPFAFGGATTDKPAGLGFLFGAHNSQSSAGSTPATAGTNLFANAAVAATKNSNNNNTTTTGIVKPSFNFGAPATAVADANGNVNIGKPSFGNMGASTGAAGNTFGALAAAASNTNQNKPFTFGANNSATPQAMGANIFGGATNNNKPTNSGFFAGATAAGNSQNMQQSKPTAVATPNAAFSFGGATANSANNNGSTPFAFGGNGSGGNAAANANKPFTFGGNTATANAGNIFDKGAMSKNLTGQTSAAAFNFNANANAPINNARPGVAPPAAANIFAPAPGDRPIRRATRRLQKS